VIRGYRGRVTKDDEHAEADAQAPERAGGPAARAARLLDGLVERLERRGLSSRRERGEVVLERRGAVVARCRPVEGHLVVDVDPRGGAGSERELRRLGVPHPDRARSAKGWRRVEVRTHRDADVVVTALRAAKDAPEARPEGVVVTSRTRVPEGSVRVRRADAPPRPEDGARVLVDAEWPAGFDREALVLAEWLPRAAPSAPLRKAYGAAPAGHRGFRRRYLAELRGSAKAEEVSRLRAMARRGPLTLVTQVRDVEASAASVLADAVSRAHTPHA
jgi:uncharacterized protein YeaO (DUF488 family)